MKVQTKDSIQFAFGAALGVASVLAARKYRTQAPLILLGALGVGLVIDHKREQKQENTNG